MLNKVMIIGRVGAEPETKSGNNFSVCKLRVASSENYTDRNGTKQEVTEWFAVETFGKLADVCAKFLSKGSLVYVEGKLRTDEYTDKEGNQRKAVKVRAEVVRFLSKKDNANGNNQQHAAQPQQSGYDYGDYNAPF